MHLASYAGLGGPPAFAAGPAGGGIIRRAGGPGSAPRVSTDLPDKLLTIR